MRWILWLAALLSGCASFNDTLTPSANVIQDKFDGSTIVRQLPVSAAASVADAWHTLGFEWISSAPKDVYVTAGIIGTVRVSTLAFNADGTLITDIRQASEHTAFSDGWSSRRFVMPLADFLVVARASTVHMKISQSNSESVSTFGTSHPLAIVTKKFQPFLDKVLQVNSGL